MLLHEGGLFSGCLLDAVLQQGARSLSVCAFIRRRLRRLVKRRQEKKEERRREVYRSTYRVGGEDRERDWRICGGGESMESSETR